ncbi:MAG TPA: DNA polymerase I [Anaerolineaceae bacterium]|nr:DNA polymerase I [Anaerolineaceae bacterium]HNS06828.1 DNA polymerase I [Anaerolineaceae bacterium]HNW13246.1 DNA polymerase I [Anaerolineaceae bacterium]HOE02537.1 DNA polymerase I [Anaerolineaceae bacterium]HOQ68844.1 DNA polymerase I [Anaerolineaceae bacterium]
MPPILYLIDGHALAYRAYYAITAGMSDRMQTKTGEPTAGIFGFANVLMRLLEQEKPEYLAVAFDTGKTFRNELFPDYKATRAKMPDDLRPQIERIRQMIDAFHLPRLEKEGVEADDVLGSIATQAVEQGLGVKIITGDRDLLQLVNDRIIVNLPGSRLADAKNYSAADVKEYLGVEPEQVVDYKALVGDTSDNIPGVPGIGPKTAVTLLQTYHTLDALYQHLDEIPGKTGEKLRVGKESAYLSQELARIKKDVGVRLVLEDARTDHLDIASVENLFRELEFRTLIPRLRLIAAPLKKQETPQLSLFGEEMKEIIVPESSYMIEVKLIDTAQKLASLKQALDASSLIAFDTETTALDPLQAELVGLSLAVKEGEGYYIPLGHKGEQPQLKVSEVIEALTPALTNPSIEKAGHNIKYDALVLARYGLRVSPLSFDTMIAEWLTNPASRDLGLKDLAGTLLGIRMTRIEELIGRGKNQLTMDEVPIAAAAPYAAADAEVTLRLIPLLKEKMQKTNSTGIFNTIEMPLVPVLLKMEQEGISLDIDFFKRFSAEIGERLRLIEDEVHQAVGHAFNLNSSQQLSKVLFEDLKLEPPDRNKRTSSGHFSTSAAVLDELKGQHVVVDLLLEYRELSKLKSTYLDALPQQINPRDNRVHTSFNQTGSVTGRLASSDPNLQNIPTRTETGRQVRLGFIAAPGHRLLSVDYSQIELRIVAHMSGDEAMLKAFRDGQDIHATTAAAIYDLPLEQVTKEQRRHAKAINFGLIYGMSAFGLSRSTDLTLGEAENFVRDYFEHFPGVKKYLDQIRVLAARQGYVETMLGRRRYFPNLANPLNQMMRNREEREAINAPIQGTAADIMKIAMIRVQRALEESASRARMILQVHDELVLEVPENEIALTSQLVRGIMEAAYKLDIPLLTEARSGVNWGSMQVIASE